MLKVTEDLMGQAAAAYYRSTGTAPNRAGLRAALHQVDTSEARDLLFRAEELLGSRAGEASRLEALRLIARARGML